MRHLYLILLSVTVLISCEKDSEDPAPYYSIEGKWLWSFSENRADANTMYEFTNGNVYTYYSVTFPSDNDYWNSLDSSDRIPGVDSYTFDGDTLIWNGTPRAVTFECDGGKLFLDGQFSQLWRLSSDCE